MADTRATLDEWNERPGPVVGRWLAAAFAIAVGLLFCVWLIATVSLPDPTAAFLPLSDQPHIGQVMHVIGRNALVLALHAMACVAGFIAGSSLPLEAQRQTGAWRWIHEKAGPLAIAGLLLTAVPPRSCSPCRCSSRRRSSRSTSRPGLLRSLAG